MPKILLVEDDPASAEITKTWLSAQRYDVELARDGAEALEFLRMAKFDVILLDFNLPHVTGFDVLKQFRGEGNSTPVIMVTAKSAASDKETMLDGGADDYLTKPYELTELSARIRVQLRRSANSITGDLSIGNIVLNPEQMKVTKDGATIELLPKEFSLLEFFMRNPDKVFSAEAIMSRVWSLDSEAGTNAFRTTLTRLRKKLELKDDSLIETVHGAGYRLNSK
ncbi:MAG: DNA-binding response regulator [Cyanobacteria bacterium PR.3.49]|nr:DNA-binding response regulator [Cyanobacteria bacterium PR.3.49]